MAALTGLKMSPKMKLWLEYCKEQVDERSQKQIDLFIEGKEPFTEMWYYAMPIQPATIYHSEDEEVSIFRKSLSEELKMMDSEILFPNLSSLSEPY